MFWGVDKHFPKFLENEYFLVSAATLWSSERGKFIRRSYNGKRMFLDGGGFSLFSKYGDYPFTREEFLALERHYKPLAWVPMDYPCEPHTKRQEGLFTNLDRIEATLENLKWFSRFDDGGLIPVVQGYSLEERLYCLDRIMSMSLQKRLMAIGSLCALPNGGAIDEIVTAIGKAAHGRGIMFHLFGVTLNFLKREVINSWPYWLSVDTSAWQYYASYKELESRYQQYKPKIEAYLAGPGLAVTNS